MTGYTPAELIRRTPRIFQGSRTDRAVLERLKRDLAERRRFRGETFNYRKDGSEYIVEWEIEPVTDEAEKVAYWVAVLRDQTPIRLAEVCQKQVMEESQRFLLGTLQATAHEIRNPLAAMSALVDYNQLLLAQGKQLEGAAHTFAVLESAIGRLSRLIDSVTDATLWEQGRLRFRFDRVNLNAVVAEAMQLYSLAGPGDRFRFVAPPENQTLWILGDETRIAEVFHNLLSNAVKYSTIGSPITVTIQPRSENRVRISVHNWGPVIPEQQLTQIFYRFQRLEQHRECTSGLGLGLYISRAIVLRHGGAIWADSTAESGTSFHVELPLFVHSLQG